MKVICVNAGHIDKSFEDCAPLGLVEGMHYTVIGGYVNKEGWPCYLIEEIKSPNPKGGFKACRFIPLSEIDEKTFQRNYKTETV